MALREYRGRSFPKAITPKAFWLPLIIFFLWQMGREEQAFAHRSKATATKLHVNEVRIMLNVFCLNLVEGFMPARKNLFSLQSEALITFRAPGSQGISARALIWPLYCRCGSPFSRSKPRPAPTLSQDWQQDAFLSGRLNSATSVFSAFPQTRAAFAKSPSMIFVMTSLPTRSLVKKDLFGGPILLTS